MKNELLLPVGNMEMCIAAVHHGADAIYIGVPFFNARGRSSDHTIEELSEIVGFCHLYGVKVNLAFNVVIFQNEFPKVIELLKDILPLNPDAIIVQDLGLAKLIKTIAPHQRLHASTQMTITNSDAIKLIEDLQIDRFVLGRENSIPEIKMIREKTDKELEVFVHGALCVAYSGQCFTSESMGGRSANRGQCAQSCRLEYEIYVDDIKKDLGVKKYLVSPKDLLGIEEVPLLKEIGVNSFKIEGRLKTPEYVASTAKNYREVLDGQPLNLTKRVQDLAVTYSRGFFSGWLHGVNHQKLVDGTYSSHRGIEIGEILQIKNKSVVINSKTELIPGMGLFFEGDQGTGSKILRVIKSGSTYEVDLLQKKLKLLKGSKVYLNSNESLNHELKKNWSERDKQKRIPLHFKIKGKIGHELILTVTDPDNRKLEIQSKSALIASTGRPLTTAFIKEEFNSLSHTIYKMDSFDSDLDEGLFIHHRELKDMRRSLVKGMNNLRLRRENFPLAQFIFPNVAKKKASTKLNILLRNRQQVDAIAGYFNEENVKRNLIRYVILDFEFGKDYVSSIEKLKSAGLRVGIATTRILKPSEYYNLNMIIRCNPDVILVRNLGAIEYLRSKTTIELIGDFSLNITNSLSLNYLIQKGLKSINLSYDLNQFQLMDLIQQSDPSSIEITLHQYMPEFHMEHCVFAAFLSSGSSFKDCGKPCEKHEVKLKDPYGNMHFLKADQECRNTFFKATPQSAGFLVEKLQKEGISAFRIEALNENADELVLKVNTYLNLMTGEITTQKALDTLKLAESYGLGLGQLNKNDNYKDRKKDGTS